jgi:hypothetical protein
VSFSLNSYKREQTMKDIGLSFRYGEYRVPKVGEWVVSSIHGGMFTQITPAIIEQLTTLPEKDRMCQVMIPYTNIEDRGTS